MTLRLAHGAAAATLCPERGGLLEGLKLVSPAGRPVDVLWLPPDYVMTGSGWPGGGAPVLFPLAGRSFHEGQPLRYHLHGEVRQMPLHGFAYAMAWSVKAHDARSATLELKESPGSLALYPFAFTVSARYELSATAMTIALTVTAGKNREPMPVNLGLHPFFKAQGRLAVPAKHKIRVTPQGGAGKALPFPDAGEEREPQTAAPDFQSLIFADLAEPRAAVVDEKTGLRFGVEWNDGDPFKYVVVYSRPGEGFYCVEPWMGLPDAVHSGLGVSWLGAGDSLNTTVRLTLG